MKIEEKKRTAAAEHRRHISELAPDRDALTLPRPLKGEGNRVHILALGDVGATLLLGLKVLGGGLIDTIGIYDVNEKVMARYEMEMNQIGWPLTGREGATDGSYGAAGNSPVCCPAEKQSAGSQGIPGCRPAGAGFLLAPRVVCLSEEQLFDCDMFVFCASKSVPALGTQGDVRMMQLEANSKIAAHYGELAKKAGFKGIFAVVSDPVDPLCKAVLLASELEPGQVRGYGLGVMNKRAEYYAAQDPAMAMYVAEGRAFGPHGGDLVIANSIVNYDDDLSRELTKKTVEANLRVRELGFKPYFAPAFSSGAMSLLLTLAGEWNYSSVYLGKGGKGAFLGVRNRILSGVSEAYPEEKNNENENGAARAEAAAAAGGTCGAVAWFEDLPLSEALYERIELAYRNLCQLL